MDFDAYGRSVWAGRGTAYERGFARLTAHTAGAVLDAAGVAAGTRVLDIGTGPGVVARAAAEREARVTAVDAEPSMAEAAARNVPGADVRVAVLPDLPLPDGAFHAVTGNFVIPAVSDTAGALAELRRVLRGGGRLALTCWSYPPSPRSAWPPRPSRRRGWRGRRTSPSRRSVGTVRRRRSRRCWAGRGSAG